jgi:hypothetical protein
MKNATVRVFTATYGLGAADLALLLNTTKDVAAAFIDGSRPVDTQTIAKTAEIVEGRIRVMQDTILASAKAASAAATGPIKYAVHVFEDTDTMLSVVKRVTNPEGNPADCIAPMHQIAVWRAIAELKSEGKTLFAVLYDKSAPPPDAKALELLTQPDIPPSVH